MDTFKYVQAQPFSLSGAGAITGATSVTLKSFAGIDGTLLTMTDFGTIGFGTLEPGNGTLEEQISFTGVVQNANGTATLTGVSSVTFISPYTATSGLSKTHAGSTTFVISNTSGFYDRLTGKGDDEIITGKWTFPTNDPDRAGIGSDVDTAEAEAFVTLGQLSRVVVAGAANASTTVKGIVQLATQAQVDAKTTTGSTGALLALTPDKQRSTLLSDYVVDTGAANAYVITPSPAISGYTTGQMFSFKAATTNTTASTINVNVQGAKNLFRGGVAIGAGEIVAGQIYVIEYDGTQFQIISSISPQQIQNSSYVYAASSTGNDTYVITVSPAPSAYVTGQVFYFKADVANTGAATLNVNSLGAISVLRVDGSALANGDIAASQIVQVAYDGTNFKMLSPVANAPKYSSGVTTRSIAAASGSQLIAHGLGRTPRYIKIYTVYSPGSGINSTCIGTYDGTNTADIFTLGTGVAGEGTTNVIDATSNAATPYVQAATATIDATNITLAFTRAGSNGAEVLQILWEAFA